MRASEFIREGRQGKMPAAERKASGNAFRFRDDGIDRTYTLNRVMMAAAMHDGKSGKPVNMDTASWSEKYNTAHPYTPEEVNMMAGAIKTVGGKHNKVVSDQRSLELPEINKVSPVASFKGYPRKVSKSGKKKK
jgi:hypothetical protein